MIQTPGSAHPDALGTGSHGTGPPDSGHAPAPGSAQATAQEPVVVFRNVSIAFDGPPVLHDISFSVAPGETRILLGPAGVGKSVLLNCCIDS